MAGTRLFLLLQILFILNGQLESKGSKRMFYFHSYKDCDDLKNPWISFQNVELFQSKIRGTTVRSDMVITHDLPQMLQGALVLNQCYNLDNLDSCTPLVPFKIKLSCDLWTSKNNFWSNYISSFEPTYTCPIKKGIYKGNGTFNYESNPILAVTNPAFVYRGHLDFIYQKQLIGSVCFVVNVRSYARRA